MRALKLTNDGDIDFTNGQFSIVEGEEEIRQNIEIRLSTRQGEWFLDTNFGLDHNDILGKVFNEDQVRNAIIRSLRQEPRVIEIDFVNVTIDAENRNTTVSFRFTTTEGTVESEVTL